MYFINVHIAYASYGSLICFVVLLFPCAGNPRTLLPGNVAVLIIVGLSKASLVWLTLTKTVGLNLALNSRQRRITATDLVPQNPALQIEFAAYRFEEVGKYHQHQ